PATQPASPPRRSSDLDPRAPSGTVVGGELDDAVGLAVGHARADLHHLAVYLPVGRVHRHVLAGPQVAAGPQLDSSQVVVVGVDRDRKSTRLNSSHGKI